METTSRFDKNDQSLQTMSFLDKMIGHFEENDWSPRTIELDKWPHTKTTRCMRLKSLMI